MADIEPNESRFPSQLSNSPFYAPFLGQTGDALDLGTVRDEVAIGSPLLDALYTPQGPENSLAALRAQFPFLPILPPAAKIISGTLDALIPQDLNIAEGAIAGIMRSSGPVFLSFGGNAKVPTLGTNSESQTEYAPNNIMFYLHGTRQLSIIAPTAFTYFSLALYSFSEMPR